MERDLKAVPVGLSPKHARKTLGRGLSSLLNDSTEDYASLTQQKRIVFLGIRQVVAGRYQPRKNFDASELESLANSLREKGVLQPLLVRPVGESRYEIVAGERRWRAAKMAELEQIPAIVENFTDAQALEIGLIENVQRADLSAIEEAEGYDRLIEEFNYKQDELSKMIGKSRSHITNTLRLLQLPEPVQDYISEGKLSAGHAKMLVGVEHPERLAKRAVEEGLSVRQIERLIQLGKEKGKTPLNASSTFSAQFLAGLRDIEHQLQQRTGLPARIKTSGRGGQIVFSFSSKHDLEKFVENVGRVHSDTL